VVYGPTNLAQEDQEVRAILTGLGNGRRCGAEGSTVLVRWWRTAKLRGEVDVGFLRASGTHKSTPRGFSRPVEGSTGSGAQRRRENEVADVTHPRRSKAKFRRGRGLGRGRRAQGVS
jgi:hypothetical protein